MAYKLETVENIENLPVTVSLVGAVMRDWGDGKKNEMDQWCVTIGQGNGSFKTDYFTGIGHRKANTPPPKAPKNSLMYHDWLKSHKPQKPKVADVLYCLVRDAEAIDMSFPDWCAEYGYSDDSFKAHSTYMQCCKTAKDLRQVFSVSELSKIRELLQDY